MGFTDIIRIAREAAMSKTAEDYTGKPASRFYIGDAKPAPAKAVQQRPVAKQRPVQKVVTPKQQPSRRPVTSTPKPVPKPAVKAPVPAPAPAPVSKPPVKAPVPASVPPVAAKQPAVVAYDYDKNFPRLIKGLSRVESRDNPKALGDKRIVNGKEVYDAAGKLQIHNIVIKEVNSRYHTNYTSADRMDPVKSDEIAKLYLKYWGDRYTKKTGKPVTDEILARMWNGGGPSGYDKEATKAYAAKVKAALDEIDAEERP